MNCPILPLPVVPMPILRICALAATLLVISACTSAQIANTFQSWCRSADNCDDNTRPRRP